VVVIYGGWESVLAGELLRQPKPWEEGVATNKSPTFAD
jgi:hypothetical protein